MTITLNGTTGITLPNGSASAPAATGSDTDTGIVYGTNTVQIATGGTTAVTVDSSQNVGIGTSSPENNSGYATVTLNNATYGGKISFQNAGTTQAYLRADQGSTQLVAVASVPMLFSTANTERMRIDSSGTLLVGTTSPNDANSIGLTLDPAGGIGYTTSNSGTQYPAAFRRNGVGVVGTITTSGTSTSYNTSSDYRLKENIAPMTGALAKVSALKPCTYTWKETGENGQGFIAHELAEVVPDAVTGEKDAVNEDGSIKPQGIDTSFLVATLTAAIQELKAELDTVKTELATLKGTA